ncbi:hypothetical protein Ahy_A03g011922 [Arachis hypogaea]|uniref:SWIM-type domain-containing protein n=1 Tax=Arachis hypogaea TaxID=3818 RepID=A0A445DS85_ARAHY|nr:hypothetical protein Ahy_A03g011922 [Arachis hypogaea]
MYEVQRLPVKVSVDLDRRTCSCRLWQLTRLLCRHVCTAIAYQNRRAKEFSHNWLIMGAYNLVVYQRTVQPVPNQEYWEKRNHHPLLPPMYRKPIKRPTKKRDTRRDGPRENPDPHRKKRRYGLIKYKYCLKVVVVTSQHHGAIATTKGMAVDLDEDAAREQEMDWEETLEAIDTEESASDSPNISFLYSLTSSNYWHEINLSCTKDLT